MKKRYKNSLHGVGMTATVALFAACASPYHVTSVERQRIVVDARYDAHPDAAATAFIAPYAHEVDSLMFPVVGETTHPLTVDRPESDLSNLLADIMVWAGTAYGEHPQLGVYNMGGIRANLPGGKVTKGDILDVAPFENKICFLTLSGEKLLQLFREIAHRGGEGVSHGVELVITNDGKLVSAKLHGQPIDPEAQYRVATLDYLAQGNDQLEAFKSKTDVNNPSGKENDSRFIIERYFKEKAARGEQVDAHCEGRIVIK